MQEILKDFNGVSSEKFSVKEKTQAKIKALRKGVLAFFALSFVSGLLLASEEILSVSFLFSATYYYLNARTTRSEYQMILWENVAHLSEAWKFDSSLDKKYLLS